MFPTGFPLGDRGVGNAGKTSEDLLGAERGRQWKPKRNQQLEDAARKREADFFGQRVRPADRVDLPGLWGKLWTVLAPGRPSRDAASRGTSALPLARSARVGGGSGLKPETLSRQAKV